MSPAALSFLVLGAVVVLFAWNRLPVEIVALGSAVALYFTGVLGADQIFSGFGDPVVIFIAALFVVSAALDVSGVTAWAGQRLMSRGNPLLVTMLLVAGLTALISVNGAVAALLPMVVLMAVRTRQSPSQLALPLAFAAHAGSMLLLTGTPINVIVTEAARDNGAKPFGFFEFALTGLPLLAGTIVIIMLFSRRLLPVRTPRSIPPDLSQHARTLVKQYRLDENVYRLQATRTVTPPDGITIVGKQAQDGILIVRGPQSTVERFAAEHDLTFLPEPASSHVEGALITPDLGVAEVVVSPRSSLIGSQVFPGMVTESGDLVVLAVERGNGQKPTTLAAGDTLLLQGTWKALDRNIDADPGVLAVDQPGTIRAQAAPLGNAGKRAIGVLVAMIVLLATGAVPLAVAALLAAGAMVVLGVITMPQAYRGISWTTLIIVGAMIPMSVAIQQSGAADIIADALVRLVGGSGPRILLLGIFLFTAILGQMISNTATALIITPIAISAATSLGVSLRPVLMCVAIAAAASFLTPVATPANMMVKGPGGYRFGDYSKLGLPLLLWFGVVAVLVVPVFWRF
ncbi:SLC13 family permease [Catelliglobosispora koreensis]|uniref:SLC13 family permease n=1 Tax=Catelliglobosispora koreensis TaxID=129052 RepID=UPI0003687640|nr:SLC13 family permease [Catelliglobosispora koreensis]